MMIPILMGICLSPIRLRWGSEGFWGSVVKLYGSYNAFFRFIEKLD
ncbi:hypothetical protein XSR1_450001 [Xenorhabdus szentirmaii DSM 16338]|uniref:Uncharacterized protein n=1 Tax=Xenorhabdus szentirmaii DSM 16338 TaxID=1427518 RepID=W1J385_9GAMM|nr:hypothetical protein XSR1_450001 [Xenorhabdus szentirmaii DSM 16338]